MKNTNHTKLNLFLVFTLALLFTILSSQSYALKCEIKADNNAGINSCPDENIIFRIYGGNGNTPTTFKNAHILKYGDLGNDFDYTLAVCCEDVSRSAVETEQKPVLKIYDGGVYGTTALAYGTHASTYNNTEEGYTDIKFGSKNNGVECVAIDSSSKTADSDYGCSVQEGYQCIVKMYNYNDSHVTSCSDSDSEAKVSLCCRQNIDIPGWQITKSRPDSVTRIGVTEFPITIAKDEFPVDLGKFAINISIKSGKANSGITTNPIPIKENTKYDLSVWVYVIKRPESGEAWNLYAYPVVDEDVGGDVKLDSSAYYSIYNYSLVNSKTELNKWQRLNITFKTKPGIKAVKVSFTTDSGVADGEILVDNFNLVELAGNDNVTDKIPTISSDFNYGCCAVDECWNNTQCVKALNSSTLRTSFAQWPYPVCLASKWDASGKIIETQWSIPFKKSYYYTLKDYSDPFSPDFFNYIEKEQWAYCPTVSQCWRSEKYSPYMGGQNGVDTCYLEGEVSNESDFNCNYVSSAKEENSLTGEDGWNTKTELLIADILTIAKSKNQLDDYTLQCDSSECFIDNPANPQACDKYSVTCVYRHAKSNTEIIGMIAGKNPEETTLLNKNLGLAHITQSESVCKKANEGIHPANMFIELKLKLGFGGLDSGTPPTDFDRCFTDDPTKFTNADIFDTLKVMHPIKSIGWHNKTKIILISNTEIDYASILKEGNDIKIIKTELSELYDYYDNLNKLPKNMSNNSLRSDVDLIQLANQSKFFNNIFIHKSTDKKSINLIEKQNDFAFYVFSYSKGIHQSNSTCFNLLQLYNTTSFAGTTGDLENRRTYNLGLGDSIPEVWDIQKWFNCTYSYTPSYNISITFALMNNFGGPSLPTYYGGVLDNKDKIFLPFFWKNMSRGFRDFDKCVYMYNYTNSTVPKWEIYNATKAVEYLSFDNPASEGCCPNDKCWNGYACVSSFPQYEDHFGAVKLGYDYWTTTLTADKRFEKSQKLYHNFSLGLEESFVCMQGRPKIFGNDDYITNYSDWEKVYRKDAWNNSNYGYCLNNSACWDGNVCQNNSYVFQNHYCLDGNWTTKTHLLALTLLQFQEGKYTNQSNYTLECSNSSNISRTIGYMPVCTLYDLDRHHYLIGLTPYYDPVLSVTNPLPLALKSFIQKTFSLNTQCYTITSPQKLINEKVDCTLLNVADYNGTIKKVFWNETYQILVLTNDEEMVVPVKEIKFITKMWNWLKQLFGFRNNVSAPDFTDEKYRLRLMINKTKDFDTLFYRQDGRNIDAGLGRTFIEGLRENYNETTSYTTFLYTNLNVSDVCKNITQASIVAKSSDTNPLLVSPIIDSYVPKSDYLPLFMNCTSSQSESSHNYSYFIINAESLLTLRNHKFDNYFWYDLTYRFINYSMCTMEGWHDSYAPGKMWQHIKPYEYVLFNHSSMSSCCKDVNSCWDGHVCQANYTLINYSAYNSNFAENPDDYFFYCANGTWTNATRRWSWTDNQTSLCPYEYQCYLPDDVYKRDINDGGNNIDAGLLSLQNFKNTYLDPVNCTTPNFKFVKDHYCNNGTWTTRTSIVASLLREFADKQGTDYTLHCDNYQNVLNYLNYDVDGKFVAYYFSSAPKTNNVCVLQYKDTNGKNRVAVGTSLNPSLDTSEITSIEEYLTRTLGASYKDACANVGKDKIEQCSKGTKIWWDNNTKVVIYDKDGIALIEGNYWSKIKDFLSNPTKVMLGFIKSVFTRKSVVPTDTFENNRLYIAQVEGKTIIGAVRDKNQGMPYDRYIIVRYQNVNSNICNITARFNTTFNCTAEQADALYNYTLTQQDFKFMNNSYPYLTSRLRLYKQN